MNQENCHTNNEPGIAKLQTLTWANGWKANKHVITFTQPDCSP